MLVLVPVHDRSTSVRRPPVSVSPGNRHRNRRIYNIGKFFKNGGVKHDRDAGRNEQTKHVGAGNFAAVVDIGDRDRDTYRSINAEAHGALGVAKVAVGRRTRHTLTDHLRVGNCRRTAGRNRFRAPKKYWCRYLRIACYGRRGCGGNLGGVGR